MLLHNSMCLRASRFIICILYPDQWHDIYIYIYASIFFMYYTGLITLAFKCTKINNLIYLGFENKLQYIIYSHNYLRTAYKCKIEKKDLLIVYILNVISGWLLIIWLTNIIISKHYRYNKLNATFYYYNLKLNK